MGSESWPEERLLNFENEGQFTDLVRLAGDAVAEETGHRPALVGFTGITDAHRLTVRPWFERMRGCGDDVRELFHDGCPVACVGDAPFGHVNAFKAHASVGFFHGAALQDPAGLLQGTGKYMRHVKVRPGQALDRSSLEALIAAAYRDIVARLRVAE